MISNKKDYIYFLLADKNSLSIKRKRPRIIGDEIWRFQILLRKYEYFLNCKKSMIYKPYLQYIKYMFHRASFKLDFSIPPNVFGPGLSIPHRGPIIINSNAKIGKNCRIHVCTNIGTEGGYSNKVPILGDNIYIAPGVKLFGKIEIADNIAIGANAVVNKSFLKQGITIAGIPAKQISEKGSYNLIIKGTDEVDRIYLLKAAY